MLKDIFLVLALVLVACVDSWSDCVSSQYPSNYNSGNNSYCGQLNCPGGGQSKCEGVYYNSSNGRYYFGGVCRNCFCNNSFGSCASYGCEGYTECSQDGGYCSYYTYCTTQAEADSSVCLNSGKLWLDGVCKGEQDICEDSGGTWEGDSCKICDEAKQMPNECERVWNTGYNLQGYWSAVVYAVTYNECDGSYTKTELSNVPEVECSDIMSDSTSHPARCLAVVGSQCVMQSGNGQTYNCDCDGDCTNAMISTNCEDPFISSNSQSSDSQSSDSQSSDSQSSNSQSSDSLSSDSGSGSSPSGGDSTGGDWEYNYHFALDSLKMIGNFTNANLYQIGNTLNRIDIKLGTISGNSPGSSSAGAGGEISDSLSKINQTLEAIQNNTSSLSDSLPDNYFDISSFTSYSDSIINKLKNPDTTFLSKDSLVPDTTNFRTKYSKFFLSNNLTRNGCYEFHIKSTQGWKIGQIDIDFGNLAGLFDFCAIFRGIVRIAGAILCLIMTIYAYRQAFSGGGE